MNPQQTMNIVTWIIFCIDLLIKYGPRLLSLLLEIYKAIELWSVEEGVNKAVLPASDEKAARFRKLAAIGAMKVSGVVPSTIRLIGMTEDIWKRANGRSALPVNKDPRPLDKAAIIACRRRLHLMQLAGELDRKTGATA